MPRWRQIFRAFFPSSASCNIATIDVSVNRLRLMVVSLQGDPAGKLQLQYVAHKGKLTDGEGAQHVLHVFLDQAVDVEVERVEVDAQVAALLFVLDKGRAVQRLARR